MVIEKADILPIISDRIELIKRGADYWAPCPFHAEQTASFSVSASKGFYHCFGCGAHGDAIDFVQAFDRVSWIEAHKIATGKEAPATESRGAREARKREEKRWRRLLGDLIYMSDSDCGAHCDRLHAIVYKHWRSGEDATAPGELEIARMVWRTARQLGAIEIMTRIETIYSRGPA